MLILNNLKVCFNKLHKSAKRYSVQQNAEDLHHFRLEFKRIEAIYTFLCVHNGGLKEDVTWLKFRKVYRKAGKERAITVANTWLKRMDVELQFAVPDSSVELPISKLKKWSKHLLGRFKSNGHKDNPYELNLYLQNLKQNALINITTNPPGKIWHHSRKQLKQFYFLSKLLPEPFRLTDVRSLVNLTDLLGDWHDLDDLQHMTAIHDLNPAALERITHRKMELEEAIKSHDDVLAYTFV
jgi:CHAD domain-containing protein